MHSEPQQTDAKKSNGCLIAALIIVMVLILPPLLLLGLCGVLSSHPSDQSFGLGVFAVIVISIIGVVYLINEYKISPESRSISVHKTWKQLQAYSHTVEYS